MYDDQAHLSSTAVKPLTGQATAGLNGGNPAEDKRIIARVEAKRLVGPPGFEFPGTPSRDFPVMSPTRGAAPGRSAGLSYGP